MKIRHLLVLLSPLYSFCYRLFEIYFFVIIDNNCKLILFFTQTLTVALTLVLSCISFTFSIGENKLT